MADKAPLFPKASSMHLLTGNMISSNRLKKKPNLSSLDELCDAITETISSYVEAADRTKLQYANELHITNSDHSESIEESERGDVKITLKVFIHNSQSPNVIPDALNKVLNELGTTFVESLLLAVCRNEEEDESVEEVVSMSTLQKYWEVMEDLVAKNKVLSLGACDLGKEKLEALYNWAKVKPCVNQVNLESCCVLPKDLTEYAKAINVQLLTHNDSPVFLTKDLLEEKIESVATEENGNGWSPEWVARYSGILKCRGIIKTKGYIVHARRECAQ